MKSIFTPSLTLALLGLMASSAHAAALQNGTFTQGLLGWQTAGDVSVQSVSAKNLPLGNTSTTLLLGTATTFTDDDAPSAAGAYNLSGNDPVLSGEVDGLEASLGLPSSALGGNVFEGSSARQTFNVSAGDTVSFDFKLASRDSGVRFIEPDTAWLVWQVGSGNASLSTLSSTASSILNTQVNGWITSGWQHISFTAGSTGVATLGFAIADVNSFTTSSLLGIQNVAVTPSVPEPANVALALTGLVLLGRAASRRTVR